MTNEKSKRVILQKKIEGEIYDLYARNHVDNVIMDDGVNLAEYLEHLSSECVTQAEKDKIAQAGRILEGVGIPADLNERDLFLQIIE